MLLKYPTTSKTLLEKIRSGDEISWDEFYQKYSPVVKALARYRGVEDADDICQQVMMQFFKQSKTFKFDPDIARFRTYFGRGKNFPPWYISQRFYQQKGSPP